MYSEAQVPPSNDDLLKNSSLNRGSELEREENPNLKQQGFERVSQDVDFDRALAGWIIKQRSKWRESRQPETQLNGNAIP